MERKAAAQATHSRNADGRTALGLISVAGWSVAAAICVFLAATLGHLTHRDLLIGLLAAGFVVMAFASISLVRQDLNALARSKNNASHRRPRR